MKIVQLLPTLSYGDAIGNEVFSIDAYLKEKGYQTEIYAELIGPGIKMNHIFSTDLLNVSDEDIVMYHMSTGTRLNEKVAGLSCKKVMIYHNITPAHYFNGYNKRLEKLCKDGRLALQYLADEMDFAYADSAYNAKELKDIGYRCPVEVLPIQMNFKDFDVQPDAQTVNYLKDGKTNILFTGRIAPNKKQEDVIRAFYHYQKYYNPESRLILVGSANGCEKYADELKEYVHKLDVQNVYFTGHIRFEEMIACYKSADAFLCMSEHEGFCVPLLEAMYFHIPIVAYDSSAVGETLGDAGILVKEKNYVEIAAILNRICTDEDLKSEMVSLGLKRIDDFKEFPTISFDNLYGAC